MKKLSLLCAFTLVSTSCSLENKGNPHSNISSVEAVSLYNPDNLATPLDIVGRMRASQLPLQLDSMDYSNRSNKENIKQTLNSTQIGFLMMALAGMEYYPVGEDKTESELDTILKNTVNTGSRNGSGSATGLNLVKSVKKTELGFRSDIVEVKNRQRKHLIVSIRGTQVKQPGFIKTSANLLADLMAKGTLIQDNIFKNFNPNESNYISEIRRRFKTRSFNEGGLIPPPVVHSGFLASTGMIYNGIEKTLLEQLQNAESTQKPCVWITGHSLGGGMAPLVAYLLARGSSLKNQAEICGVYTFGAPRVGNYKFLQNYNNTKTSHNAQIELGSVTFRYELQDDVIPHVPPQIPFNDTQEDGSVAELVAESLIHIAIALGQDLTTIDDLLSGRIQNINEEQQRLASIISGAGGIIRTVHAIVKANGLININPSDVIYNNTKKQVMNLLSHMKNIQHVGHTRWINKTPYGKFEIFASADPDVAHVESVLSWSKKLKEAYCYDAGTGAGTNLKRYILNTLQYHRAPFYAAVLSELQTKEMNLSPLTKRISLYEVPHLKNRLSREYSVEQSTFYVCN